MTDEQPEDETVGRSGAGALVCVVLLVLTVGQLLVATFFASGLEQFEDKGFGARLVLYPVMMLTVPAIWWLTTKRRDDPPWAAFAWIMLPFLVDVTGNTLNLYDAVGWWDDANHFVNWMFLGLGAGLLITRGPARPRWEIVLLVAGVGAIMAIFWEIGEYYAFIRGGTELDTAYTDTLGDEVLGTLGALTAGVITAVRQRR
ncbi:hypothetical protein GCM10022223_07330 [Kineosporia mesophila]|uniref:Uncharacterized protein n=1 Tax=Kineosporia mesophila TaxID=566012 RepID=A0ABP6YZX6_9ACTN|nr:hypothetical protein [Kineosporia mesophila]MCD5351113.1 hypothetical protein [Kineosporia mesophila]